MAGEDESAARVVAAMGVAVNSYMPLVVALVVQAVLGIVFLVGFVAVMKRFMDKEIPALLQAMNEKLAQVQQRVERISSEFAAFSLRIERHIGSTESRLSNLEGRGAGRSHGET